PPLADAGPDAVQLVEHVAEQRIAALERFGQASARARPRRVVEPEDAGQHAGGLGRLGRVSQQREVAACSDDRLCFRPNVLCPIACWILGEILAPKQEASPEKEAVQWARSFKSPSRESHTYPP